MTGAFLLGVAVGIVLPSVVRVLSRRGRRFLP